MNLELVNGPNRDPYWALGALGFVDADRSDRYTLDGSSTVTSYTSAAGGAIQLTGSGLTIDGVNTLNGRKSFLLDKALNTQSLKTTTSGPTGAGAFSLSCTAAVLTSAPDDVGTLVLMGRAGASQCVLGVRTDALWFGGASTGALDGGAFTIPGTAAMACTYDGSTLTFYRDGQLIAAVGSVTLALAQGWGATPWNASFKPPDARLYRFGAFASNVGLAGIRRLHRADTVALGIYQPSEHRSQGDSITAGLNLDPAEAWPKVAAGLINSGRYESILQTNVAVSGRFAEALDISADVNALNVRRRSSVYTISLGNNDLRIHLRTAEQTIAYLLTLAETAEAAGYTVIFTTILPYDGSDARRVTVNNWIKNESGRACIDLASVPEASLTGDLTYYQDGIHPTAVLAALLGAFVAARLTRWLA